MKRNQVKRLVVALAVVMAFTFTACSSSDSAEATTDKEVEDSGEANEEAAEATGSGETAAENAEQ